VEAMEKSWVYDFFKPDVKTVREIFDGKNFYQVPDYQRPYSWGDDEIETLWEDIYSAFKNKEKLYFLGPLILAPTREGEVEIVDGQQRLTTLTILFCVLRDVYFANLKNEVLKRKISNAIRGLVEDKYRLRLITQAYYQDKFEKEVLKEVRFPDFHLKREDKEKQDYRFMNAASIFKEKLGGLGGIDQIQEFADYIFEKVVMITIHCSSRISAIRLFQIINTRGLDLSNADLIKSYLYSRLKEEKVKQFNFTWSSIEILAQQINESINDLLTYYGYYSLARKPQKSLYEELTADFDKKEADIIAYDFKKFVEHFKEIYDAESKVIYSLWYLPDQVFWKTILTTAVKEKFGEFEGLCKELQKLYYLYWIAGYTMAKTRNLSFDLIKMVKESRPLYNIKSEIQNKMREDKLIESVEQNLKGDVYGKPWLKPLLILVEYEQTDNPPYIEIDRRVHVDHILPQEWKKIGYWKTRWNEEQAGQWLHKIGNLTLLSGRKNIKASNDSFKAKMKIYEGKGLDGITVFQISQKILNEKDWTPKEIKRRQKWLISEIKRILGIS
jgi:uncharacterized protein with ParB-like and HNH nuclease domain